MDAQKKVWTKPVLIIVGRGTPEEAVLGACKTSLLGDGPDFLGCAKANGGGACAGLGQS